VVVETLSTVLLTVLEAERKLVDDDEGFWIAHGSRAKDMAGVIRIRMHEAAPRK